MKKRKPVTAPTPEQPVSWPGDDFRLMAELVLHAHVGVDDLAKSMGSRPEVLAEQIRPLIDRGFVEAGVAPAATGERPVYRATENGRDAFFAQVAWLGKAITDTE